MKDFLRELLAEWREAPAEKKMLVITLVVSIIVMLKFIYDYS